MPRKAAPKILKDRLARLFLESLDAERNASPRTILNYRLALEKFSEQRGLPPWKECQPDHFRAYLFAMMKAGAARSTIRLHFAALRTFYKFLMERHGLKVNPLKQVQLPKLHLPKITPAAEDNTLRLSPTTSPKFHPLKEYSLSFTVHSKIFYPLYLLSLQQHILNSIL